MKPQSAKVLIPLIEPLFEERDRDFVCPICNQGVLKREFAETKNIEDMHLGCDVCELSEVVTRPRRSPGSAGI